MKLGLKIPLAFAAALLLMFAGALYGIFKLNQSIDTYRTVAANSIASERMVSQTLIAFKLQVQEWKDRSDRVSDQHSCAQRGRRSSAPGEEGRGFAVVASEVLQPIHVTYTTGDCCLKLRRLLPRAPRTRRYRCGVRPASSEVRLYPQD
ncbi:methyl-accepting chemotaxis sensory transducer [Caballeronia pedi]|uniref:Methyl-accepting chemotaxis sensory transducer n=1 Tax=Caballeronia pedi TaxID=1777141 RepID=A0A158E9S7_9BURK|nr:methyl-accepting chemotaxis sensory transducer [Caballeronia pedi]